MISTHFKLWTIVIIIYMLNSETSSKNYYSAKPFSRLRDLSPLFQTSVPSKELKFQSLKVLCDNPEITDEKSLHDQHMIESSASDCYLFLPSTINITSATLVRFLSDITAFKQWTTTILHVYPEELLFCNCLKTQLLLADLSIKCVLELPAVSIVPIISLQFLTHTSLNFTEYESYLLRGNERQLVILCKIDCIESNLYNPHDQNYKWTLVIVNNTEYSVCNRTYWNIFDVYGIATANLSLPNYLGFWSESTGLNLYSHKWLGLENFQQAIIRITTVPAAPVVYTRKYGNGDYLKGSGYLPDILESISVHLNFSYRLTTPIDKSFGSLLEDGNWSGMVGELQRREMDMALMSFSYTMKRKLVMDFSTPVEYSHSRLLIRRDTSSVVGIQLASFFRPLHWHVWLSIPVTVFIGTLTLLVFSAFIGVSQDTGEVAWVLACCFLMKGQWEHPARAYMPLRVILGTVWILCIFIYACYTARLTSFLADNSEVLPVKSLAEAVNNKGWKVGGMGGSSFIEKIKESSSPEMRTFYQRIKEDQSVLVKGFSDGIDKVYKQRYIFFTSDLVPSFLVKGNCSFAWIPGKYFPGFGYMGFQKNFPMGPVISNKVARLRETGQTRRFFLKWWGTEATCGNVANGFKAMSLYETVAAFFILLIGMSLAALFIFFELRLILRWRISQAYNVFLKMKS